MRISTIAVACLSAAAVCLTAVPALAQSCWNHNGSIMRIVDRGGSFTITYVRPRDVLRRAGVRNGTVLANGRSAPGGLSGVARRFSRHCVGAPMEYNVSGFYEGDYSIVLTGQREVHNRCRPTGRFEQDELLFDYVGAC